MKYNTASRMYHAGKLKAKVRKVLLTMKRIETLDKK